MICKNIFIKPLFPNRKSYGADVFKEKFHLPPPVSCQVSHVMCHASHVTCQMSHVPCKVSQFFFGQCGEARQWRVCYQQGLINALIGATLLFIALIIIPHTRDTKSCNVCKYYKKT